MVGHVPSSFLEMFFKLEIIMTPPNDLIHKEAEKWFESVGSPITEKLVALPENKVIVEVVYYDV